MFGITHLKGYCPGAKKDRLILELCFNEGTYEWLRKRFGEDKIDEARFYGICMCNVHKSGENEPGQKQEYYDWISNFDFWQRAVFVWAYKDQLKNRKQQDRFIRAFNVLASNPNTRGALLEGIAAETERAVQQNFRDNYKGR